MSRAKVVHKQCKTCSHPERAVIDVALAERRPMEKIGQRYSLSLWSLWRHRRDHMPPSLVAQLLSGSPYEVENLEQLRVTEGERLLSNAVEVRRRLYANAEGAERAGDWKGATLAYAQVLRSLELIGKLLDQFRGSDRKTINQLVISPDYLRLRGALITALAPYPQARQAVAAVLRSMEEVEVPKVEEAAKEATGNGAGA